MDNPFFVNKGPVKVSEILNILNLKNKDLNIDQSIDDIKDFQPHQTTKKQAVYARHQGMKKNNLPSINTKNLRIEELYKLNDNDFNKKQEEGVAKRVGKL